MSHSQLFVLVKCDSGYAEQVGEAVMDGIPEVLECYSITGNYDLLLKCDLPDLGSMAGIIQGKLHKIPHIRETNTFLSFRVHGRDIGDFGD